MLIQKLLALAMLSVLGLSMSAAQAQGFDHRNDNRGFHQSSRHGEFRHGHQVRHHKHHNRHHRHHGHR